jgi:hypothetical protein
MGVLVDPLEVRLPHFYYSNNKVMLNIWNFTPGNYMSTSMSLCFFQFHPIMGQTGWPQRLEEGTSLSCFG